MANIELLYLYYSVVVGPKWSRDNHLFLYMLQWFIVHYFSAQSVQIVDGCIQWSIFLLFKWSFYNFCIHFLDFIYSLFILGQWSSWPRANLFLLFNSQPSLVAPNIRSSDSILNWFYNFVFCSVMPMSNLMGFCLPERYICYF